MDKFYGIFKRLATENHYTDLTKSLNSAATTRDTKATMKPLTRAEIKYAHMGQLVIKDDICYTTFIQNPGDDGEQLYSQTSEIVLAVFSLEKALAPDFIPEQDITYYPIGGIGHTCAGHTAKSICKCNSMCLIEDEIYICFCFQTEDDHFQLFRIVFDILTGTFGKETTVKMAYRDKVYLFDADTTNFIYETEGRKNAENYIVEVVSRWSEYNGEFYATYLIGSSTTNNGIVIKTKDFETMEFVDTIPNNELGSAEASSYIYKDVLYVACRQDYFHPFMVLNAYDLKNGKWYDPNYFEDGTCRPWFFEKDGDLYLINTTEEYMRRYANISRIVIKPQWKLAGVTIDTIATLYDCGFYFAVTEYKGKLYFVASGGIEHHIIRFGELKLAQYDIASVNDKLLSLFEE